MNTRIISLEDSAEWSNIISKAAFFDFYHTAGYQSLEKEGTPLLFVAVSGENFIAIPLIKRSINGSCYFDITSAYGYCGPVSNKDIASLDEEFITSFQNDLKDYFSSNKIVTAFSRLHPLINSENIFKGIGSIKELNKTVSIDLTLPVEEQRRQYRKSLKSEINQLRRKGYIVRLAQSKKELDIFYALYNETMDRVNASGYYYFDREYFDQFLSSSDFSSKLLLAYINNEIAAGAIFTVTNTVMQYHLAATSGKYISDAPMKLVIDEARLMGTELKLDHVHLGGGVGGSDEDSLFRFKSGFSDLHNTFKVWNYIANKEVYEELVSERQKTKTLNPQYFPLYRG